MTDYEALCEVLFHENWEDEMAQRAIAVKWSEDRAYFLLKYNQIASDFNDPVVRACRGIIFRAADRVCVCHPFDKFGNYGEAYTPDIDWNQCVVWEKIDGSLIKCWYDGGWHLSTNGTIDAFSCGVGDFDLTFGELFERIIGQKFVEWAPATLNPHFTYLFELTAPENRVVIQYSTPKLWFLGRRDMRTHQEDWENDTGMTRPGYFRMKSLDDCIAAAARLTKDEEGYVVCDAAFNRIKVKSPSYLIAAHLANNGAITTRRIIRMIQDLSIDDFLAYCDGHTERVNEIQGALTRIANRWETCWQDVAADAVGANLGDRMARKIYAQRIAKMGDAKSFLFRKYTNNEVTPQEFLLNMTVNSLKTLIEKEVNV